MMGRRCGERRMAVRGRVWRVGKWAALLGCALVFAFAIGAWGLSLGGSAFDKNARWTLCTKHGEIRLYWGGSRFGRLTAIIKGDPWGPGEIAGYRGDYDFVALDGITLRWAGFDQVRTQFAQRGVRGCGFGAPQLRSQGGQGMLVVPCGWLTLSSGAAFATCVAWGRWRRIRSVAGRCAKCGYDLTKNESGRCPECGVRFAEQSTVKTSTVKSEAGDESEVEPLEG